MMAKLLDIVSKAIYNGVSHGGMYTPITNIGGYTVSLMSILKK